MAHTTSIIPANRPRITRREVLKLVRQHVLNVKPFVVVGIRGYYERSMGDPTKNDRGIYDDAICLLWDDELLTFNANTDPAAFRTGSGHGSKKGMASLKPGIYPVYAFDLHKGRYVALCQRGGPVTVIRDGDPPYEHTGYFGINIHKGGLRATHSEGCQTIPPGQWEEFISTAQRIAQQHDPANWRKNSKITYVLVSVS